VSTAADSDAGEKRLKRVEFLSQDVQSNLEVALPTVEAGVCREGAGEF